MVVVIRLSPFVHWNLGVEGMGDKRAKSLVRDTDRGFGFRRHRFSRLK